MEGQQNDSVSKDAVKTNKLNSIPQIQMVEIKNHGVPLTFLYMRHGNTHRYINFLEKNICI